jgi:hypothetical protein
MDIDVATYFFARGVSVEVNFLWMECTLVLPVRFVSLHTRHTLLSRLLWVGYYPGVGML